MAYSWRRVRAYLSGVVSLGTDSSGRRIYVTRYMRRWFRSLERELGWSPVIVQGGFMTLNGGGAKASAGIHDGGGCIDFRSYNLTASHREQLIRACRRGGAGAWLRNQAHGGMDPHIHIVLGADYRLTDQARRQFVNYVSGFDGLASGGKDYHWRPSPIVTKPPREWVAARPARRKKR